MRLENIGQKHSNLNYSDYLFIYMYIKPKNLHRREINNDLKMAKVYYFASLINLTLTAIAMIVVALTR